MLLLPHYLTEAGQEGLINHVEAVCKSVKFGVIVYNRNVCKLTPESLAILADRCPNLIGFKDGVGEIETMVSIYQRMGIRGSLQGAGHAGVFVGGVQLHPEDGDGLLQRGCQRRHGHAAPAAA